MNPKERGALTEPMFYVLMAFLNGDMCGTDITQFVRLRTGGRVSLGPGTLYTLLGKFMEENLIEEIEVHGRKRTYRITEKGLCAYGDEVERLRTCLADARAVERGELYPAQVSFNPAPVQG